jgi:uncharacterized protein
MDMMEIPPLPEGTILLVEVGSTAHGTGLPGGEDNDEMGVVVEDPGAVVGLDDVGFPTVMQRTQPEGSRWGPGDTDRTLHSLRRFLRLAASGNPSILMALWAPVLFATDDGRQLQDGGELFVGGTSFPVTTATCSPRPNVSSACGAGDTVDAGAGTARSSSPLSVSTHAMHGARLGFQGIELLTQRRLEPPIHGEPAEWLRAVRRGEVPFLDWWHRVLFLDAELESMLDDDSLPVGPDRDGVEWWSVETHLRRWAGNPTR